jgi:signal transduction histidine kinase
MNKNPSAYKKARSMLPPEPPLTDALLEERARDKEREEAKIGGQPDECLEAEQSLQAEERCDNRWTMHSAPLKRHDEWPRPPWRRRPPLPPHLDRRAWAHHRAHPWAERKAWHKRRAPLFFRFVFGFGFILLLLVGGMAVLAFLLARAFGGGRQMAALVWIIGLGLAVALPLLALRMAMRAFRGIATPLAGIMSAADAVAEGDLSARVPEQFPGEFGRLASSFNHMVEELERADQRRRNLTADVAHELRTPLHIIQGNLEGILDGVYEADEAHVNATLDETRLLSRLVEDLRTLSLAEGGQLPLHLEAVDVGELLGDVRTSFSGQAEAAGIELRVELADDLPDLTADVGRLDQVLGNLMSNAIRHTPPGGTIWLRAEPIEGGVRITVRDTGEGIPSEDLPYVFDRFWRGDRARTRGSGVSSGLGLAISRQLVRAHGGRIRVESALAQAGKSGGGSTFTLELPADIQAA